MWNKASQKAQKIVDKHSKSTGAKNRRKGFLCFGRGKRTRFDYAAKIISNLREVARRKAGAVGPFDMEYSPPLGDQIQKAFTEKMLCESVEKIYRMWDKTYSNGLIQLEQAILKLFEGLNRLGNTPTGDVLEKYDKLSGLQLWDRFNTISQVYSVDSLVKERLFGPNRGELFLSENRQAKPLVDGVVGTLHEIKDKIERCQRAEPATKATPPRVKGEPWHGEAGDTDRTTSEVDIINDFCNWTDKLIDYMEHPDESREVSKARIDTLGDQVNNLAQKTWPQISLDETGWPYQPLDNWGYLNRWEEGIFSAPREQKEKLVARLQQWKTRALEDKRRLREELRLQVNQEAHQPESPEGVLEAKAPEIFQNLLWMRKYGAKHWKLILLAAVILLISSMFVLPQFNVFSTIRSLLQNIRP